MATYNKFNGAVEDIFEKVHDMDSDQWQIALTTQANAPTASTATSLSSITQIAYSVGFTSTAHFTRAFKRQYHCTPLQWRQDTSETPIYTVDVGPSESLLG